MEAKTAALSKTNDYYQVQTASSLSKSEVVSHFRVKHARIDLKNETKTVENRRM